MKKTIIPAMIMSAMTVGPVYAQTQINEVKPPPVISRHLIFPGSLWTSNGLQTPSEKDYTTSTHLEQGISFKGMELYGTFTGMMDTKKFDWNRRTIEGVGIRFTQNVSHGIVRVGVAYMNEKRFVIPQTFNGMSVVIESWLGWK
jgi:hypothetical protein